MAPCRGPQQRCRIIGWGIVTCRIPPVKPSRHCLDSRRPSSGTYGFIARHRYHSTQPCQIPLPIIDVYRLTYLVPACWVNGGKSHACLLPKRRYAMNWTHLLVLAMLQSGNRATAPLSGSVPFVTSSYHRGGNTSTVLAINGWPMRSTWNQRGRHRLAGMFGGDANHGNNARFARESSTSRQGNFTARSSALSTASTSLPMFLVPWCARRRAGI